MTCCTPSPMRAAGSRISRPPITTTFLPDIGIGPERDVAEHRDHRRRAPARSHSCRPTRQRPLRRPRRFRRAWCRTPRRRHPRPCRSWSKSRRSTRPHPRVSPAASVESLPMETECRAVALDVGGRSRCRSPSPRRQTILSVALIRVAFGTSAGLGSPLRGVRRLRRRHRCWRRQSGLGAGCDPSPGRLPSRRGPRRWRLPPADGSGRPHSAPRRPPHGLRRERRAGPEERQREEGHPAEARPLKRLRGCVFICSGRACDTPSRRARTARSTSPPRRRAPG